MNISRAASHAFVRASFGAWLIRFRMSNAA